jgi:hypothetical protein
MYFCQKLQFHIFSHVLYWQQGVLSCHMVGNAHHWATPMWGAAAVVLSDIFTTLYIKIGDFKFFHLKPLTPSFVAGQEKTYRTLLSVQTAYSSSLLLHYNLKTTFLNLKNKWIKQYILVLQKNYHLFRQSFIRQNHESYKQRSQLYQQYNWGHCSFGMLRCVNG